MREFKNRKILITGAASGLGLGLVESLAARGSHLVLIDLNGEALTRITESLKSRFSEQSFFKYTQDLARIEDLSHLREKIRTEVGPIDALINNAGVVFGGAFHEIPLEKHWLTYDINLKSLVTLTHLFYDDLLAREDSHLVNISSASGLIPLPLGATYASSKWAVLGFSDSLRVEQKLLGKSWPHITTVCPSYFSSGMFSGVKPPLLTPLLSTERVVELILQGMKRNKDFVMAPRIVYAIEPLRGLLPRSLFDKVASALGVTTSMTQWKGRTP